MFNHRTPVFRQIIAQVHMWLSRQKPSDNLKLAIHSHGLDRCTFTGLSSEQCSAGVETVILLRFGSKAHGCESNHAWHQQQVSAGGHSVRSGAPERQQADCCPTSCCVLKTCMLPLHAVLCISHCHCMLCFAHCAKSEQILDGVAGDRLTAQSLVSA